MLFTYCTLFYRDLLVWLINRKFLVKGIYTKFPRLWDAKIEKKYMPKINNYTKDSIYMVQQFAYVHGVARISQFSGKNTRCGSTVFSLKNNTKTLISKKIVFISCAQDSQWATKWAKNFSQGLGPIGLSLRSMDQVSENLPLKTITILYQVGS